VHLGVVKVYSGSNICEESIVCYALNPNQNPETILYRSGGLYKSSVKETTKRISTRG